MAGTWAIVKGMVVDPVTTAPLAVAREGWRGPLSILVAVFFPLLALGEFLYCVMAR